MLERKFYLFLRINELTDLHKIAYKERRSAEPYERAITRILNSNPRYIFDFTVIWHQSRYLIDKDLFAKIASRYRVNFKASAYDAADPWFYIHNLWIEIISGKVPLKLDFDINKVIIY